MVGIRTMGLCLMMVLDGSTRHLCCTLYSWFYLCFCLYDALDMLVVTVFVSLVFLKAQRQKTAKVKIEQLGGTTKDKALDYSDSVEDLKNVVTNSMQGKMYAYKNRKRRRMRPSLTYNV